VALLPGLFGHAGTELASAGKAVFAAAGNVTFGAVYAERAIKATVVTAAPVSVTVNSGRQPANVFLGDERLPAAAWRFDAPTGAVTLAVPAGTSTLQLRFDDLADLKPFAVPIPVVLVLGEETVATEVGTLTLTVASETARGALAWTGPEGLYRVQGWKDDNAGRAVAGVTVSAAGLGGPDCVLLQPGTTVQFAGEAPAQKAPLDRVVCRLLAPLAAMRRVPKEPLFAAPGVVVEGEALKAEGGGAVSRSTEHAGTHGGGCIYAWGAAGHWIAWEVAIPADGQYVLTLLGASQEKEILRTLAIDGQPAPGAAVMRFAGTGGWGRTQAEEWQAAQPVDAQGAPVRFALKAGTHELRLTNPLGQHLNVDCIVLTPTP
jgi:hypothetical protein